MDKIKRIWFISDTHLGVRNNSNEWMEIMEDYFDNWFFPLLEREYQKGDILIHLGDWYDSRQSVNLKVLNLGISIAERLSSIFVDGIYVLIGNHDIWGKTTNEINSLKSIKWIPNFRILEDPEVINFGGNRFLMVPWRSSTEDFTDFVEKNKDCDFLCCHTDIAGLKFNKHVDIEHGTSLGTLSNFKGVYSGHIHYGQKKKNVTMVGSPYELTRSDLGNKKKIYVLDLETLKETEYINERSPKHVKILFDDLLEKTLEEADKLFRNNFVDVLISPEMTMKAPLGILTEEMSSSRRIVFQTYDPDSENYFSKYYESSNRGSFDAMSFISEFVESSSYDDKTKERIIKSLDNLYKRVVNKEDED